MKLGFIGYGSLGRQIETMMREDGKVLSRETVYFDDMASAENLPSAVPFNAWQESRYEGFCFVLALGYRALPGKYSLIQQMQKEDRKLLSVIHSSAIISPSATIKDGVIIFSGCVLDQGVEIESGTIMYNSTTIAHDSHIGKASFLAAGVIIAGNVLVGDRVFMGCGCSVANTLKIGDDCIIGIGSVVTNDLAEGCSAIGNPIRVLPKRLNLR